MIAPLVYVIVINWNGRQHLEACFSSLLDTTYANAKFLLVDNASTDDSVAYVRERFGQDPRVQIMPLESNLGWSGGNNAGIRRALEAGAAYCFLLNNDTATDAGAIGHLVGRMEADALLGALAPRMVLFDQPGVVNSMGLHLSSIGAAWDIGIGRFDGPRWHIPQPVAGVCGGACFLRASVLASTGLLPEDFEIYLDDLDLCLRIWEAGFEIRSCAEAVVRHKFSATMGEGARARWKYYLNTRNRFRILLRHFPAAAIPRVAPRVFAGELRALCRSALCGAWWRVPCHVRAWFAALAYAPEALRFRRGQIRDVSHAFWLLVEDTPMFCPEVTLPVDGWYPPILTPAGERLRPMARQATVLVPPGPLQVRLVNCYPALGVARISLLLDGALLDTLHTEDVCEMAVTSGGGTLTAIAESAFLMEDTGAPHDTGAWLQFLCDGAPLL